MKRWNVQINIWSVEQVDRPGVGEQQVTDVLKLKVTADTELDAYLKAHRMLTANEPVGTMPPFAAENDVAAMRAHR